MPRPEEEAQDAAGQLGRGLLALWRTPEDPQGGTVLAEGRTAPQISQ